MTHQQCPMDGCYIERDKKELMRKARARTVFELAPLKAVEVGVWSLNKFKEIDGKEMAAGMKG